jgi:periplasmic protein TonB
LPDAHEGRVRETDNLHFRQERRLPGILARCGAAAVALGGHLAILLAMTYAAPKPSVGEPPIAIAVELVTMPNRQSLTQVATAHGAQDAPAPPDVPSRMFEGPMTAPAAPLPKAPRTPKKVAADRSKPAQVATVDRPVDSVTTETSAANNTAYEVSSTWKARLLTHLDRHKRYPDAARARREEGTALLSFGMDRGGHVLGYFIARSSGHADLDDEVLAMIQRASPLPPAPPELVDSVVQLVVPVRFSAR